MIFGRIRYLIRFIKMQKEKFIERKGIAYHEAGHALMGYFHGHTTNFIDIKLDVSKGILPNTDKSFGNDECVIIEFHNSDISSLKNRTQIQILDVAKRYTEALLAGTMSEYWYLYRGNPKFENINKNDKDKVFNCINNLYAVIGTSFNRNDFLNERLNNVRDYICDVQNFNKIEKIADALLKSRDFRIERLQIEDITK